MFVIKLSGQTKGCYVAKNEEPCFNIGDAMPFLTRQAAADFIVANFKQWDNVTEGCDVMRVMEV